MTILRMMYIENNEEKKLNVNRRMWSNARKQWTNQRFNECKNITTNRYMYRYVKEEFTTETFATKSKVYTF